MIKNSYSTSLRIIVFSSVSSENDNSLLRLFHHEDRAPGIAQLSKFGEFELVDKYSNVLALFFDSRGNMAEQLHESFVLWTDCNYL